MSVITTKEELIAFYEDEKYWPETNEACFCVNEETLWWGEKFDQQTVFELDALQALPSGANTLGFCRSPEKIKPCAEPASNH